MAKKMISKLIALSLVFSVFACNSVAAEKKAKAVEEETSVEKEDTTVLTSDEEEIIELLAEDTNEVTDETYGEIVSEIQNHLDAFSGEVYLLEGIYTEKHEGETPYIYRTMVADEEETFCGLPLKYVNKNIEEGAWVRITGIVNVHEIDGEMVNALEVVAIQTVEEQGQEVLEWNGSVHNH